jgi:putative membrane protein
MMGNWGYGYGLGSFGMIFGWIIMIAFWALIIWGGIAFVQWLVNQGSQKKGDTGIDILKERYAKGEISKEEFESKKKDLNS